ncbi:hypothetical protein CALCODRAFT_538606 [Calocera cornea HHB12733]|uniref:Myb/SANT-like domain-containing protein n=1 Tax=Calocera cornea HHB12733 TaxID=1353952 RepID=A0A165CDN9_9BASI|nr:hypothetical protein CALCODRAFT_444338 [Calocera cornea HHB12733]KZT58827.1 hypothetical protein CALCODRAFT_538606 [Calocera cornea HHB12733]
MSQTQTKRPVCHWTPAEDEELVDQLVIQHAKGNQAESGWKPVVWTACADHLAQAFPEVDGGKKDKKQVKSRWHRDNQMVTATEAVWRAYIASHSDAKRFRKEPFPLYDKLAPLIAPVIATGEHALHLAQGEEADEGSTEEDELDQEDNEQPKSRKRKAAVPSGPATKRVRASGAQGFLAMAEAVKGLSEAMVSATSGSVMTSPERQQRAIQLLQDEEGFSDEEIISAVDLFARNQAVAFSYAALSKPNLRTLWLRKKLREDQAQGFGEPFGSIHSSPLPSMPDYSQYSTPSFMGADS